MNRVNVFTVPPAFLRMLGVLWAAEAVGKEAL
jgi:hypothetical protein